MKDIKENKENFICEKIKKLIHEKGLNNSNVVEIIDKNSNEEAKAMCTISLERMNEITDGSSPTLMECILIGQALEKGIGYFYFNGYQVYRS